MLMTPIKGSPEWSAEEVEVRNDCAAAYRLFAQLGWHELIYNHITAKIPGTEHFLINLFGLMYREALRRTSSRSTSTAISSRTAPTRSTRRASSSTPPCTGRAPTRAASSTRTPPPD